MLPFQMNTLNLSRVLHDFRRKVGEGNVNGDIAHVLGIPCCVGCISCSHKNLPKESYHHFIIAWLTKDKYRDRRAFHHLSHNILAAVDSVQQGQLSKGTIKPTLIIFIYWSKIPGLFTL